MKKVILIGDSIRMGYDKYVKEALCDKADVFYPSENCKFAEYVLRFAHDWKDNGGWPEDADLVHWNAGLWDALELFGDEPLTSLAYYEEAIARIDRRLRMLFPKAKMIFATSTSVVEERCSKNFRRHNATIEKYNEAALRALASTDTLINDLYEKVKECPDEYRSDSVHFNTDGGRKFTGDAVIEEICKALDITRKDIGTEDFTPESYTASNIGY